MVVNVGVESPGEVVAQPADTSCRLNETLPSALLASRRMTIVDRSGDGGLSRISAIRASMASLNACWACRI